MKLSTRSKFSVLQLHATSSFKTWEENPTSRIISITNDQHCAKYFTYEFIVTEGCKAIKNLPNIDDLLVPALQDELKKLQDAFYVNKKKTIKPLAKIVKCCSIKCKSTGNLDTKNTDKYAQCKACKGFEHFNCANVKDERKSIYISGVQDFLCSRCFAEKPRVITQIKAPALTTDDTIETTALVHAPDNWDKEGSGGLLTVIHENLSSIEISDLDEEILVVEIKVNN